MRATFLKPMLKTTLIAGLFASTAACATVVRGTHVDFNVNTVPQGAAVMTDLETKDSKRARRSNKTLAPVYYSCDATPCALRLPRKAEFMLTLEKDGYHLGTIPIESNLTAGGSAQALSTPAIGTVGAATVAATSSNLFAMSSGTTLATAGLFWGGIAGLGVDAASGAMLNLYPNPVTVRMVPEGETVPAEYATFGVVPALASSGSDF